MNERGGAEKDRMVLSIVLKSKIEICGVFIKQFSWQPKGVSREEVSREPFEEAKKKILKEGMTLTGRRRGDRWEIYIIPEQIESIVIVTEAQYNISERKG